MQASTGGSFAHGESLPAAGMAPGRAVARMTLYRGSELAGLVKMISKQLGSVKNRMKKMKNIVIVGGGTSLGACSEGASLDAGGSGGDMVVTGGDANSTGGAPNAAGGASGGSPLAHYAGLRKELRRQGQRVDQRTPRGHCDRGGLTGHGVLGMGDVHIGQSLDGNVISL